MALCRPNSVFTRNGDRLTSEDAKAITHSFALLPPAVVPVPSVVAEIMEDHAIRTVWALAQKVRDENNFRKAALNKRASSSGGNIGSTTISAQLLRAVRADGFYATSTLRGFVTPDERDEKAEWSGDGTALDPWSGEGTWDELNPCMFGWNGQEIVGTIHGDGKGCVETFCLWWWRWRRQRWWW